METRNNEFSYRCADCLQFVINDSCYFFDLLPELHHFLSLQLYACSEPNCKNLGNGCKYTVLKTDSGRMVSLFYDMQKADWHLMQLRVQWVTSKRGPRHICVGVPQLDCETPNKIWCILKIVHIHHHELEGSLRKDIFNSCFM